MVIGIIAVIGWIVAQVLGKMKGGNKTAPPPGETTTPTSDPQDELRKFFEEMERNLKPQPEPKQVVVPPPPPPVRPAYKKHEHVAAPVRVHAAEPAVYRDVPEKSAEEAAREFMRGMERAARVPVARTHPQSSLMPEGLRDPQALRKMIVTMEVLGKPVALRQA